MDEEVIDGYMEEAQVGLSDDPRTAMEFVLHSMGIGLMDENNLNIHSIYRDTSGYSLDQLTETRMPLLDPVQYYSAIFAYFEMGNEEAWAMLAALPETFRLSMRQEEEWLTMQLYLAFLDNLKGSERNIKQLTEDELTELIEISETPNGGSAAGWASNALCFHYGICRPATAIEAPELIAGIDPKADDEETQELVEGTNFRIVPNPTTDEARVISVNAQAETESLSVFDINGRRILFRRGANHRQFITSGLPNGIYFCRVVALTGEVENLKFIVNH